MLRTSISDAYRGPIWAAIVWTIVMMMLSCMVMDEGDVARISVSALLAFWITVVICLVRRPQNPTRLDVWLITWGWLLFIVGFQIIVPYVWHLRGLR